MRGWLHWARETRASRRQLWVAISVSASVCLLILLSVGAPAGWDAAALGVLRARDALPGGGAGSAAAAQTPGSATLPSGPSSFPSLPAAPASLPTAAPASSSGSAPSAAGSTPAARRSGSASGGSGSAAKTKSGTTSTGSKKANPSPIKHVFVITLATAAYSDAFGPASPASYLNGTLRPQGELLSDYQTLSGVPLADSLALIGGQRPNPDTQRDCPNYTDFPAGHGPGKHNLMPGRGCVYPNTVLTLGDQLDGAGLPWRGFMDGMSSPCQHPNSTAADAIDSAGYDPRENPIVFFHSLLDLGDCQSYDLPLTQLNAAVSAAPSEVPSFTYIAADPCDGGAAGCPSSPSTATSPSTRPSTTTITTTTSTTGTTTTTATTDSTVVAGDAFLKRVVPSILGSPAYVQSGALLILFSATGGAGQAGAPTGALLLSPFVQAGSTERRMTNVYGVLRTLDKVFGLPALGMARRARPIRLIAP